MIDNRCSFMFRIWVRLHDRPLRLSEMRPLWREVRRFLQMHNSANT